MLPKCINGNLRPHSALDAAYEKIREKITGMTCAGNVDRNRKRKALQRLFVDQLGQRPLPKYMLRHYFGKDCHHSSIHIIGRYAGGTSIQRGAMSLAGLLTNSGYRTPTTVNRSLKWVVLSLAQQFIDQGMSPLTIILTEEQVATIANAGVDLIPGKKNYKYSRAAALPFLPADLPPGMDERPMFAVHLSPLEPGGTLCLYDAHYPLRKGQRLHYAPNQEFVVESFMDNGNILVLNKPLGGTTWMVQ